MHDPFIPVADTGILEQLFAASYDAPVVLFQHDPFCGTSAAAHRQVATLAAPVHLVDVAHQQNLSRRIALRTGVRHESPQVLVLHDGAAVWSASHRAITTDAVQQALQAPTGAAR